MTSFIPPPGAVGFISSFLVGHDVLLDVLCHRRRVYRESAEHGVVMSPARHADHGDT